MTKTNGLTILLFVDCLVQKGIDMELAYLQDLRYYIKTLYGSRRAGDPKVDVSEGKQWVTVMYHVPEDQLVTMLIALQSHGLTEEICVRARKNWPKISIGGCRSSTAPTAS